MGRRVASSRPGALFALSVALSVIAAVLTGCNANGRSIGNDVANGKQVFIAKCGTCHVLAHAGTKGVTGPNLDQAFNRARKDGLRPSTFQGMVRGQIQFPNREGVMPAGLVKGQGANDVAAYVASVAGVPGKDRGALASVGQSAQKALVVAQGGKLEIDAVAAGLLFTAKAAKATAGPLTITMKNPSSTQHNIALESNGKTLAAGKVVGAGGVSIVSAPVAPGKYTFYCQVPGHRAAGMLGTLTVN